MIILVFSPEIKWMWGAITKIIVLKTDLKYIFRFLNLPHNLHASYDYLVKDKNFQSISTLNILRPNSKDSAILVNYSCMIYLPKQINFS